MRRDVIERVHGGIEAQRLLRPELRAREVLDFSVNLNPYGPCAAVVEAVRAASLVDYPDSEARAARAAWARALDVPSERIAVGNGAAELLWLVARVLLQKGDRALICEPTFSELRVAAEAVGAQVERVFSRHPQHAFELEELTRKAQGARLVYLCAPNNPTGEGIEIARLCEFARQIAPAWLVLDQSFLSLSDHAHELAARLPDNVIALRSLTKDFALAGLRIGYLLAQPDVVTRCERARPTWHTGAPALAAMEAAAEQGEFVRTSWARMRDDREQLCAGLSALGFAPLPSVTGYVLVQVGDAPAFVESLLQQGIYLRDASSFGLSGYVRVAARPEAERTRLLAAWARCVSLVRGTAPFDISLVRGTAPFDPRRA